MHGFCMNHVESLISQAALLDTCRPADAAAGDLGPRAQGDIPGSTSCQWIFWATLYLVTLSYMQEPQTRNRTESLVRDGDLAVHKVQQTCSPWPNFLK